MSWTVEWSKPALKDLRRMDPEMAQRVIQGVGRLAESGHGDVKKLKGVPDMLRLRIGDWRILFRLYPNQDRLLVLQVTHRGDVYR